MSDLSTIDRSSLCFIMVLGREVSMLGRVVFIAEKVIISNEQSNTNRIRIKEK